jgi:hypothetical protein
LKDLIDGADLAMSSAMEVAFAIIFNNSFHI